MVRDIVRGIVRLVVLDIVWDIVWGLRDNNKLDIANPSLGDSYSKGYLFISMRRYVSDDVSAGISNGFKDKIPCKHHLPISNDSTYYV